jgi:hypothetical protein
MPATYKAIATVTVGSGGAANIEFTSIPATYTDLVLLTSTRVTASGGSADGEYATINFNSTGALADSKLVYGGSAVGSLSKTDGEYAYVIDTNNTASTFNNDMIYIPNYASSNKKSFSVDNAQESNGNTAYVMLWASLWDDTSAITSIKLNAPTGTFQQYSTATLYGIKNS